MADQQPAYTAYTVVKREGADDWWVAIGGAFAHADGDGFNIMLQALPTNAKIVLRPPKSGANQNDAERDRQSIRQENERRKNTRREK